MLTKLLATISKTVIPNASDIALCEQYFEPVSFHKNSILEEQGKIPEYLYFINSGYMRMFYDDENGDEVVTNLSAEGSFIASFLSFINGFAAKENVECITDCELLRIAKPNLRKLIDESENFKQFNSKFSTFIHFVWRTNFALLIQPRISKMKFK